MPAYEFCLMLRAIDKEALGGLMLKACRMVVERGGVVRDVQNIGKQVLPYRMRAHQEYHEIGRLAYLTCDMAPAQQQALRTELKLMNEVIRHNVVRLPDAYRPPAAVRFAKCKTRATQAPATA